MTDLATLTGHELMMGYQTGQFSVTEVAQACIRRIEQLDPQVQAWAWFSPEHLLQQAKRLDTHRGDRPPSPLWGIPVGIKDIITTQGIPTGMGSPIFIGHIPHQSAPVVEALEQAGALMAGKTVTTEFAYLYPGKTRNPWNLQHTPGGSSSGSAAAVAARFIPLALGTQTQGSVIRPASFCGLVGFKPSYGLISRQGIQPLSPSLDHVGTLTRTVADAALLLANLNHSPTAESLRSLPHLKRPPALALIRTSAWAKAYPAQQQMLLDCAQSLEAAGARVEEVSLPPEFDPFHEITAHLMLPEVADIYGPLRDAHPGQMSDRLSARIDVGLSIRAVEYLRAIALRQTYRTHLASLLERWDAILTLSTPGEAPKTLDNTGNPIFCELWSLTGLPAIALPTGLGPTGLPVGVQLVGGDRRDDQLLAIAQWCEKRFEGIPTSVRQAVRIEGIR